MMYSTVRGTSSYTQGYREDVGPHMRGGSEQWAALEVQRLVHIHAVLHQQTGDLGRGDSDKLNFIPLFIFKVILSYHFVQNPFLYCLYTI